MGTPIRPFSNGTEFMIWQSNNCDRCCRYENKSTSSSKAKCSSAFAIDMGTITGYISYSAAKRIGFSAYNGMDGTCTLNSVCNNFNKPIAKKLIKSKKYKDQLALF